MAFDYIVENVKSLLRAIGDIRKGFSRKQEDREVDKFFGDIDEQEIEHLDTLMALYTIPELGRKGVFYEDTHDNRLFAGMVSFMLIEAVERKVSTVTITPLSDMVVGSELDVQFKIDGYFVGGHLPFPRRFYPDILSGLKKLAGLDTDTLAYTKQEGKTKMTIKGRPYDITVRTESTPLGDILEISGLERSVQQPRRPGLYIPGRDIPVQPQGLYIH